MRAIENRIVNALVSGEQFWETNTRIVSHSETNTRQSAMFLHGNEIATLTVIGSGDKIEDVIVKLCTRGWNTRITRSRMNLAIQAAFKIVGKPMTDGVYMKGKSIIVGDELTIYGEHEDRVVPGEVGESISVRISK